MQKNDLIGIAGVFILTFFLLLLYHLMSSLRRPGQRYKSQIKLKKPGTDRRHHRALRRSSRKNGDWLLSSQGPVTQAGSSRGVDEPLAENHEYSETTRRSTHR